ncbi:cell division topological specificity factor MinE [Synechococcus sp. PCC 7502]|uniref:cell division topological specificity factor MinE n=1 Tax=Synechococcus sp. PCC 7502 TaxID=1173263 RepID=UPI00059DCB4F|nr:cell division topological specificity factor MinE [Synechococcus sp. PCC 7502]
MITEILERLFAGQKSNSRGQVKQRLKFILAHDRAALTPKMLEDMRKEILAVVSKYVELDEDGLDVTLESDNRMTALIANLPIRKVRNPITEETSAEIEAIIE